MLISDKFRAEYNYFLSKVLQGRWAGLVFMQKNKNASLNKRHEQDVSMNKKKGRYFVVKSKNTHLGFFLRGGQLF